MQRKRSSQTRGLHQARKNFAPQSGFRRNRLLKDIYDRLYSAYGPQNWWPGDSPLEVAVGAILTQNTNWANVEKAVSNLKAAGVLSVEALHELEVNYMAELIRPAGYFNIKTRRLKNFIGFIVNKYQGSLVSLADEEADKLRAELLAVNGIGPETADSIMLYALDKPVFVIDAYTKRVMSRHNILHHEDTYNTYQEMFHATLPKDTQLFNEYHALIVRLAKDFCKTKPVCSGCPLEGV